MVVQWLWVGTGLGSATVSLGLFFLGKVERKPDSRSDTSCVMDLGEEAAEPNRRAFNLLDFSKNKC